MGSTEPMVSTQSRNPIGISRQPTGPNMRRPTSPRGAWYRNELYLHEPAQCHRCHPALERKGEATTRTLKV